MPVVLYGFIASPPLRSTMMTCEALGVDYRLKVVEAFRREHLQPEYLKVRTYNVFLFSFSTYNVENLSSKSKD